MADIKFSDEEIKRINKAAAHVESVSSGEVLTAVIRESSNYAAAELLFSVIGGFIYYLIALGFHSGIESAVSKMFWLPQAWHITAFYGASTIVIIGLIYILTNIPGFDRMIVPKPIIARSVHRRALVHFTESGAVNTRDRTGILFFISMRERRVEIIADEGINAKVQPGDWEDILNNLLAAIKEGKAAEGLEKAVLDCAEILGEHFPVKGDDTNELPDGIVFLED
ncbi:MAG: TPM domain-containing protein [Spirochaetales bacterium]|uniref:TPM domain-containing protein n=1 Tax=Candidatus Thalassospirochaeta sargassi TaxID=3119039 RepID=A0AAJ1IJM1_9SPIO|nr:TPM domain-containing protein [Spirochaetales bacterium]